MTDQPDPLRAEAEQLVFAIATLLEHPRKHLPTGGVDEAADEIEAFARRQRQEALNLLADRIELLMDKDNLISRADVLLMLRARAASEGTEP